MENQIRQDCTLFLASVLFGFFFGILFEGFRFFRKAFPHNKWTVAAEDLFFWLLATPLTVFFHYAFSDGIVRWFSLGGIACGFYLYLETLGKILSALADRILSWLSRFFRFLFLIFIAPLLNVFKKITNYIFTAIKRQYIIKKNRMRVQKIRKQKILLLKRAERGFFQG